MAGSATDCDVAVVGGGPAGLAAATTLASQSGLKVWVLEREAEAGGIPRHCGHPPYGLMEFGRLMTGPRYAEALVARARAAGVEIRTGVTVTALNAGPTLQVASAEGVGAVRARAVLLATGVRERSRAGRFIGGTKPGGVMNTGALQGLVYLKGLRPFRRPVVVGTELVAFSALLTCRHAGIRPVAMVEAGAGATARWPCALFPGLLRIPLWRRTEVEAIEGERQVTGVVLRHPTGTRRVACDGVILTGGFRPDAVLVRASHLAFDAASGGPEVDQFGRCSDPDYFAAGNLLRAVETAGWSFREGVAVARAIMDGLNGALPAPAPERVLRIGLGAGHGTGALGAERAHTAFVGAGLVDDPLAGAGLADAGDLDAGLLYAVPQRVVAGRRGGGAIQLRAARPLAGELSLWCGERVLARRTIATRPERRLLLPLRAIAPDVVGEGAWRFAPRGQR